MSKCKFVTDNFPTRAIWLGWISIVGAATCPAPAPSLGNQPQNVCRWQRLISKIRNESVTHLLDVQTRFSSTQNVVRSPPRFLMSMRQKRAMFPGMLLALSMLAGCSSAGGGSVSAPAPTATLTASPTTITGGGNSTLTFTSTNASGGSINNGIGPVGMNSHIGVAPTVTTTYIYTATGPGGTATAQATITVTPPGPAPTVTLSASPTSTFAGQSITLTWTSTNATLVVIDNNLGAVQPVSGGSSSASPAQTTTYTITATGNGQQTTATATVTVSPVNSFNGLAEDLTAVPSDVDPNGAVGTKQFMEYVNTQYQAYDKTTFQPVWSTPQSIDTPWAGISQCSSIPLDAVINFDRLASRWVIGAKSAPPPSGPTPGNFYCIAVSSTDDLTSPSLVWYAYYLDLAPYLPVAQNEKYAPDWSKLGTWPNAYVAGIDILDGKNDEVGVLACAFDRMNMLINNPTPNSPQCIDVPAPTYMTTEFAPYYLAHSLIPADVDGTTPPPAGRDSFLVSIENPSGGGGAPTTSDIINLWDFHIDWATPSNTTLTWSQPFVPTYTPGCYDTGSAATTVCVPEPQIDNTIQFIDSVGDRMMPRFAYRNFGTYESFLISHTVLTESNSLNPLQTGIRWYELRDNLSGIPSLYQSGTISPDASLYRFLPSLAQDKMGNAAVGYSVSSFFTDPGVDFSYWNLSTTPNAPTFEVPILNGTAEEFTTPKQAGAAGYGAWGSYSSMTVDPVDDCTFWYVNEYYVLLAGQTNSTWATRIANFKMPTCQ